MNNLKEYIVGLVTWAIMSSAFTFVIILFGADKVTTEVVGIVTWRLIILIFLCNCALNAILVRLNR